jgi:hypothetical protein
MERYEGDNYMIGVWFPVTKGQYALVDRDLYEEVTKFKWTYHQSGHICRKVKIDDNRFSTIGLHQFIIFRSVEEYIGDIDHRNLDKRDCRRENLRVGTRSQNQANMPPRRGRKYKGVFHSYYKDTLYIRAGIRVNNKLIYLGSFNTDEEAALAYNEAAIKYFGEFALLNEIEGMKEIKI